MKHVNYIRTDVSVLIVMMDYGENTRMRYECLAFVDFTMNSLVQVVTNKCKWRRINVCIMIV